MFGSRHARTSRMNGTIVAARKLVLVKRWMADFRLTSGSSRSTSGHVSLKQTVQSKGQYESMRTSQVSKESSNPSYLTYNQRSENGYTGYVPYSPYAWRRREISRAFCCSSVTKEDSNANTQRPFSPYRQFTEQGKDAIGRYNGQSKMDRSYSPYKWVSAMKKLSFEFMDVDSQYLLFFSRQDSGVAEVGSKSNSPCYNRLDDQDNIEERWHSTRRSLSRDYSPWRRENVDPPNVAQLNSSDSGRFSSYVHQRLGQIASVPQANQQDYSSPMASRRRWGTWWILQESKSLQVQRIID